MGQTTNELLTALAPAEARTELDAVVIGTSSVCNASCIHCPTGKAETGHLGSGIMPMDFFQSIIDQLASQCKISLGISFGLYGDSLLDPLIVERARYVKARLPDVWLQLNTNAAAYSPAKHAVLSEIVDMVVMHIESLRPDVYNFLMRPLRLDRVLSKADLIIRDFGQKTIVSNPLHRLNAAERQNIVDYFLDRGCGGVQNGPLNNRCSSNTLYEQLAFSPLGPICRSADIRSLIVDWDGAVFPCCNDFEKEMPLGNLHVTSIREIFSSQKRTELTKRLDAGDWASVPTCSKCSFDRCEEIGRGTRSTTAAKATEPVSEAVEEEEIAEKELRAVYASTSWRITAPVRGLRRIMTWGRR